MVEVASIILLKFLLQKTTLKKTEFSKKDTHELLLTSLLNDCWLVQCQVLGFSVKIIAKAVGKK
jgi:hypothetical protein